jgi:hypothetical protein
VENCLEVIRQQQTHFNYTHTHTTQHKAPLPFGIKITRPRLRAMTAATSQKQIAALLKDIVSKGVETKDAIPLIKILVEAKIFSLNELNEQNMPPTIDRQIQKKLLPKSSKKKRAVDSESTKASPKKQRRVPSKKNATTIVKPTVTFKPVEDSIVVNRSPVLTLWSAVVAQQLYPKVTFEEALSLGSAVSAQLARSKGTSLGIYQDEKGEEDDHAAVCDDNGAVEHDDEKTYEFHLMDLTVLATQTEDGLRARSHPGSDFQDPSKTYKLLSKRFGSAFGYILNEMEQATWIATQQQCLGSTAYKYYMHIRPDIPNGTKGWGAHGRLYMSKLSSFYSQTKTDT